MQDPFVKLYASLLESSLWWSEDTPTRLVWITLLLAADHEGYYSGTLPGLAGKARVTLEEARHAVWRLQQPDAESRSKNDDGRRIEAVDGGFRLINYLKYREKRTPKQVKDAAWKAAQRARDAKNSVPDMSTVSGEVSLFSDLRSGSPDPERARAQAKGRFAPIDYEPNELQRVRCQELKLDIAELLKHFKLHEFNRDYSDWTRRFSWWIEQERVKRETEGAKASRGSPAPRHGVITGKDDRGFPWTLEASEGHARYAEKHGLDLNEVLTEVQRRRVVETLGLGRAKEVIGELLTKRAREKGKAEHDRKAAIGGRPDARDDPARPRPRAAQQAG